MLFAPRTKLKIFQIGLKANFALAALNLGCIGILLLCEEPVGADATIAVAFNAAIWYVCLTGIEFTKKVHGLDDKGNFSFKNMEGPDARK